MSDDPTQVKTSRRGPRTEGERPCLEVVRGREEGRLLWPRGARVVLGRGDDLDITLEEDGVSRRHARLIFTEEGIVNLQDLGSTNGTFVNGAPIDATVLREGDRIQLGPDVTLRFSYRDPGEAHEPTPAPPPEETFPVSARELEIAELVAEGLTNPQVGERLHISRHTVVSHLSNLYERTGVSSRTALAKLVAQRRLVKPG